ncbi:MAG: antibiotic biosynthesis monooxygenase [Cytophagales bacterium]|nr:MAG: antibiotic biosynthesis monooxygenase [Cytophagales bacterium]
MIVRIVRMTFQPERIQDFLNNFDNTKQLIRAVAGCHHLELLQDQEQSNVYCTYSWWESEEHLNQYRKSALFGEVWTYTKTLFAEPAMAFSLKSIEKL